MKNLPYDNYSWFIEEEATRVRKDAFIAMFALRKIGFIINGNRKCLQRKPVVER